MKCKKILVVMLCLCLALSAAQAVFAKTFTDIQGHWGQSVIEELAEKGVINGETEDIYNPEGPVLREQFIKLLVAALTDDLATGEAGYADISSDFWANKYIVYGREVGILKDDIGAAFEPERAITRNEAAVWLGRAVVNTSIAKMPDFTDADKIQNPGEVAQAVYAGLMQGNEDGSFAPEAGMTRAEAAAVISRLMAIGKVPALDAPEFSTPPSPSPEPSAAPEPSDEPDMTDEPAMTDIGVKPVRAAMGKKFTLMLKNDGTVWSSGDNRNGQLGYREGYGKLLSSDADINANFKQIPGLSNIKAVYATEATGFAIDAGGSVWSWGSNDCGELGTDAPASVSERRSPVADRSAPKVISDLENVVQLACGPTHVLALTKEGEVYGWGNSTEGQIGMGDQSRLVNSKLDADYSHVAFANYFVPLKIEELGNDVTEIAAGVYSNLAVKKNGDIWGWGSARDGMYTLKASSSFTEAIDADSIIRVASATPAQIGFYKGAVTYLKDISGAAIGRYHALALTSSGEAFGWGDNAYGQIGCGNNEKLYAHDYVQKVYYEPDGLLGTARMSELTRKRLDDIKQLAVGGDMSAALRGDGTVWIWGANPIDTAKKSSLVPIPASEAYSRMAPHQVKDIENVTELHIGYQYCDGYQSAYGDKQKKSGLVSSPESYCLLAIKSDGTVWSVSQPSKQIFDLK